jgi:bifunctional non-homologous end joining protein LigD
VRDRVVVPPSAGSSAVSSLNQSACECLTSRRAACSCDPADFTVATMPQRFAAIGDPHAGMDNAAASLEKLLELAARDEAEGIGDAPWPPHFRKAEGEGARVAPSRAKGAKKSPAKSARGKMPLLTIANSESEGAAQAGLERWRGKIS